MRRAMSAGNDKRYLLDEINTLYKTGGFVRVDVLTAVLSWDVASW